MGESHPARQVVPYGDAGLLVELTGGDSESRWQAAQQLREGLTTNPPPGMTDLVVSFASVFLAFDPLVTDHDALAGAIGRIADLAPSEVEPHTFEVPVVYGGVHGPDLDRVADCLGLSPTEVVELHSAQPWVVRLVGSPAGAPLMDGPSLPRSIPRLDSPRTRVEPGSVGLSGSQCIVYNAPSPGGWQLIGRTPLRLFDVDVPPHVAYRPGDRLRFRQVLESDWATWAGRSLPAEDRS